MLWFKSKKQQPQQIQCPLLENITEIRGIGADLHAIRLEMERIEKKYRTIIENQGQVEGSEAQDDDLSWLKHVH